MDLQLINTLCESRIFRNKADLTKYTKRQKQDLYYAVLLSTVALALDNKTTQFARQYASAAAAFANFDFFRVSANDLYVLTYIAQNELRATPSKMQLLRLYKGLGRGNVDRSFLQQFLLRLERSLFITDTRLRNARRAIVNWGQTTAPVRKQSIQQLWRFIHVRAKLAEVLPYLKVLLKGKAGGFGKGSALKDIAAAAAGGLAGLAVGMRANPDRQWRIFDDVEQDDVPLNEDRPTQLFQIVQDLKAHPEVDKVVDVKYLADGISAFVRTTDGNAYEMQIRPAKYAQGHHKIRGVREGWEWTILGESMDDMTGETCTRCSKGQYVETGIQDDMQGVLHCNNKDCRMQVDRRPSGDAKLLHYYSTKYPGPYDDELDIDTTDLEWDDEFGYDLPTHPEYDAARLRYFSKKYPKPYDHELEEDVVDFGAAKKEKEDKDFWDKAYALHPDWKENDEYEKWFDTLSDEEQDAELAKQTAMYDEQDKKAKEYIEQFRPIIDKIVEFMNSTGADLVGDFRTLTKQRKRGKQHVDPALVAKLNSILDNEILQKRIRVMDEYSEPLKQLIDYDESMPLQINSLGQYIDDDGYDVEYFWDLLPVMQKNKNYLAKTK